MRTFIVLLGWVVAFAGCGDDGGSGSDMGAVCPNDEVCSDGVFCNGIERCLPLDPRANGAGCVPASESACGERECDEAADECAAACDVAADADGDGVESVLCGGDDCDDNDPDRYPGNPERCDSMGHDEDCDPTTIGTDADGDGYIDDVCCGRNGADVLVCGQDCDDASMDISPEASDVCNGGRDDDCDGSLDEEPDEVFYRDRDGDGHGIVADTAMGCSAPPGYSPLAGDCDDTQSNVNPGIGTDGCGGAAARRDDDCDGGIDEGCPCVEGDTQDCGPVDGAGAPLTVGECRQGVQACSSAGTWAECVGSQAPETETCDGLDNDCDGSTDEGATITCWEDEDGDGFAIATAASLERCFSCGATPAGVPTTATEPTGSNIDCMEGDDRFYPKPTDSCGVVGDDDCDGTDDEGCDCLEDEISNCFDRYGDEGVCASVNVTCSASGQWPMECPFESPDDEPDICNGLDDNCNGTVDEGVQNCPPDVCDYENNDMDAAIDEAMFPTACNAGDFSPCSALERYGDARSCFPTASGEQVSLMVGPTATNEAGGAYAPETITIGHEPLVFRASMLSSSASTTAVGNGWALVAVIAGDADCDEASPSRLISSSDDLGVPNSLCDGFAGEWRFNDTAPDSVALLSFRDSPFLADRTYGPSTSCVSPDQNRSAANISQSMYLVIVPDDPLVGGNQTEVYVYNGDTGCSTSPRARCSPSTRDCIHTLQPGDELRLGVTAAVGSANAYMFLRTDIDNTAYWASAVCGSTDACPSCSTNQPWFCHSAD